MRTRGVLTAVAGLLLAAATAQGGALLEDDFNTGTEPDPAKWTQVESTGCSVYLSGGNLVASFIGAGAARQARAVSPVFNLPSGWTELALTGQWAFPTQGYGECQITIYDPDNTATLVQASYANWVGSGPQKAFRANHTGYQEYVNRSSLPTALTDFTMTVTPTGWSFVTEGGSISKSYATTHMAGLTKVQFNIGGWEYSSIANVAHFDNIQFTPEPATLGLLAVGAVAAMRRRR